MLEGLSPPAGWTTNPASGERSLVGQAGAEGVKTDPAYSTRAQAGAGRDHTEPSEQPCEAELMGVHPFNVDE